MKQLLALLLLATCAATAQGQIIKSLGYNTTNGQVVYTGTNVLTFTNSPTAFSRIEVFGATTIQSNAFEVYQPIFFGARNGTNDIFHFEEDVDQPVARTNLGLGGTNTATFGNVVLNNDGNLAPAQTADSASSLMTRGLGDTRYLGEMWSAVTMYAVSRTNFPISNFKTAPSVSYTNGQASGPFMEAFLPVLKYAGKTVRVLAYCRADSTNGGNVVGAGRVLFLTNMAGGPDPDFPLTGAGQSHGSFGVYTNLSTDVFPIATSTNQYLIFTSNVGTIPTNAKMIVANFGFQRQSTNTTYTGNLFLQAVEVVVENP